MSRKISHTLLAAVGFSLALPSAVVAQSLLQQPLAQCAQKTSLAEEQKALQETKKMYPIIKERMDMPRQASPFQTVVDGSQIVPSAPFSNIAKSPALVAENTTIWGGAVINGTTNYWSFSPESSLTFSPLTANGFAYYVGQDGVSYSNGHIRGIYAVLTYASQGLVFINYCDLDLETGKLQLTTGLTDKRLIALETAQAADGTVYGEFYNADLSGLEFGVIDYENKTRTTFGTSSHYYVAMGVTKAGELYGIAADDANLYKIDTTTGAETLIGNTGLKLMNSSGYYKQSGEIDQRDDTFYFYSYNTSKQAALYKVNLSTGALTLVSNKQAEVWGMLIPAPAAEDGAPAAITDLTANFSDGSMTGTLSFTAPSTTFAGDALTGELTYTVADETGQTLVTGTTTAGAATSVNISVATAGQHKFVVTTQNAVGESPQATVSQWIGFDVPAAVTNLTFTIDDNAVATVTWNAPTKGLHGGNLGTLTYDVYRISGTDTTAVATDLAATTFIDRLDKETLTTYKYMVYAKNRDQKSAAATSDGQIYGTAIYPDWTEDFETASALDLFTVIDANEDGSTWQRELNGSVHSGIGTNNGNDDWLITPPMHLTTGRTYTLSVSMRNWNVGTSNTIEVKWGNAPTAEGLTKTLLSTTAPASDNFVTYTFEVQAENEGNYYFGFHDNTAAAGQYFITIDEMSVKANARFTAPDSVTNLKVVPAEKGALKAKVSFTAPAKAVNGTQLSAINYIEVTRDGETIKTFATPSPGANLSFDDVVPASASYDYAVTPYLNGDYGRTATTSAYIGQDKPKTPTDISLLDNQTNVIASWPPFTTEGANGGYVDPSQIYISLYNVETSSYGYYQGTLAATSEKGGTSVTLDVNPNVNPNGGKTQTLLQYYALANNEAGESMMTSTKALVVGPTLSLPFKESMANGSSENGLIWLEYSSKRDDAATWVQVPELAEDADGGAAIWMPYTDYYGNPCTIENGDWASLNMPKVALSGAVKPQLYFSLYSKTREHAKVEVRVALPNGSEETVATYDLSQRAEEGWETHGVDLSAYKSERYVIVKFRGICEGNDTYLGIDNINIADQKEHDLEITSFSVPTKATAGATAKTVVGLRNLGAQPAKDFDVVLFAKDVAVDTVTVSDALASFEQTSVTLDLPVKITEGNSLSVRAQIVYDADLNTGNNTTETKYIKIEQPSAPAVDDLKAESGDNVSLGWTEPEAPEDETVTETFEGYESFVTEFGDWKTVDATGGTVNGGFFTDYPYVHQGESFAYILFNTAAITPSFDFAEYNPGYAAHAGYNYAAAPYKMSSATGAFADADCWLISPLLSGKAQTLSFYANNITESYGVMAESFEVLASATDTETGSFTKLGDTYVANGQNVETEAANWKEYTVALPAGTKYFAIRQVTSGDNAMLFGLDDITYERGSVKDRVVGYNIYRDGQLIGTVDGQTTSYTDAEAGSDGHTYNVTVIYEDADGNRYESSFSNNVTVATGIEAIERTLDATTYNVYTLDGKAVRLGTQTLSGLKKGIYIINDRKFILR